MNNFTPEHLLELSKQRIQEEIVAHHLEQKAMRSSSSKR
jgi:hypothetical protein